MNTYRNTHLSLPAWPATAPERRRSPIVTIDTQSALEAGFPGLPGDYVLLALNGDLLRRHLGLCVGHISQKISVDHDPALNKTFVGHSHYTQAIWCFSRGRMLWGHEVDWQTITSETDLSVVSSTPEGRLMMPLITRRLADKPKGVSA